MRRLPMFRSLLALSGVLLLTAIAVPGLWRFDRVGAAPGALTGGSVQVRSPRGGLVAEVLVRTGQRVGAGDPLLRLDTKDLEVEAARRLAGMEALRTERSARIAERRHDAEEEDPREREEARQAVERARLRLEQSEAAARALRTLGAHGLASQIEVDRTEVERKLATIALAEAEREAAALAGRQRARLAALDAEAKRLEEEIEGERVQRAAVLRQIEESVLRAGVEGVVGTGDLLDLPGRSVVAGQEVLRLAAAVPDRFEGALSDADRALVRVGQIAKIRMDAYPWLIYGTLKGVVLRVAERREAGGGFVVEIGVEPATAPGPLRDGMRGIARIVVEEKVTLARLLLEKVAGRTGP